MKASTLATIKAYLSAVMEERGIAESLMASLLSVLRTEGFLNFFETVKAFGTQYEREKCPKALPIGCNSLLERVKLCFHKWF